MIKHSINTACDQIINKSGVMRKPIWTSLETFRTALSDQERLLSLFLPKLSPSSHAARRVRLANWIRKGVILANSIGERRYVVTTEIKGYTRQQRKALTSSEHMVEPSLPPLGELISRQWEYTFLDT